ncbi:MAG TPA: FtsQ-type POTRA domain-containing protein [Acidimicrobiales bacterium]|nr:FtsQ-type POTRA domain-containing protein [Acidimicrobiales bacterium]
MTDVPGPSPAAEPGESGSPETGSLDSGSPETGSLDSASLDGAAPGPPSAAEPAEADSGSPETRSPAPDAAEAGSEPGAVHPRVWQRRVAVLREQGHRRLRWIVGGVVVLVGLCMALLVLHTPLLALRHATVRGAQHTGSDAVLRAAGLLDHPPLIDVDPKSAAAHIEKLPWVAHAVVARHWPDSVTITVTERAALGSVARPGGGVAVVDASGRVLAWEPGPSPGLVLVAPVTPGRPGTVLASPARPALDVASALPPTLAGRVVKVTADTRGMVSLDLGGGVSAVLGSTAGLQAKLTALASVLAGAHVSPPAVIDVTVPDEPTVGRPPPAPRP